MRRMSIGRKRTEARGFAALFDLLANRFFRGLFFLLHSRLLFGQAILQTIYLFGEGFNISGGKSRHEGVELALRWQLHEQLSLRINSSYARHTYDFNLLAARGELDLVRRPGKD